MVEISDNSVDAPLKKVKRVRRKNPAAGLRRPRHKRTVGRKRKVRKVAAFKPRLTFECSTEFYHRVMHEKDERHLTVQQLALRALDRYFSVPEYVHRGIEEFVGDPHVVGSSADDYREYAIGFLRSKIAQAPDAAASRKAPGSPAASERDLEIWALTHEIGGYLKQLPVEKLRLLRDSLLLDLRYYRSARIKSTAVDKPATPKN